VRKMVSGLPRDSAEGAQLIVLELQSALDPLSSYPKRLCKRLNSFLQSFSILDQVRTPRQVSFRRSPSLQGQPIGRTFSPNTIQLIWLVQEHVDNPFW